MPCNDLPLFKKQRPTHSTNDMWLAAPVMQHDLAIFSYDQHFQFVDDVLIGKQLADFIF